MLAYESYKFRNSPALRYRVHDVARYKRLLGFGTQYGDYNSKIRTDKSSRVEGLGFQPQARGQRKVKHKLRGQDLPLGLHSWKKGCRVSQI
jgi:hypothetical protein